MTDTDAADESETDGETATSAGESKLTATTAAGEITARYHETESERLLSFQLGENHATVAQNSEGYAMVKVRDASGDERERYYGFDMALDHAGELLGVSPHDLPIPDAAEDMGM